MRQMYQNVFGGRPLSQAPSWIYGGGTGREGVRGKGTGKKEAGREWEGREGKEGREGFVAKEE